MAKSHFLRVTTAASGGMELIDANDLLDVLQDPRDALRIVEDLHAMIVQMAEHPILASRPEDHVWHAYQTLQESNQTRSTR